jgi:hypothetical protein
LLKVPSDLAGKRESELSAEGREELRALIKAPRLTWRCNPFDFFAAPPCGTPGGGHCSLAPAPAPAHVADNNATETKQAHEGQRSHVFDTK